MHDLRTIRDNNTRLAECLSVENRDPAKWGLARYVGLNFYSFEEFNTERERNLASIEWGNNRCGHHTKLFNPIILQRNKK